MHEARLAVYAILARAGRFVMASSHDPTFDRRGITAETVTTAITSPAAEIIEVYRQDTRGSATLVVGYVAGRALHMVLTQPENDRFIVVTAYWPDGRPHRWSPDYRRRMP